MESQRTAFGTVLFGGFRKDAVYQYIEQLVRDHETACKRYEHQKADLERALADAMQKKEALESECAALRAEKADLQRELDALKHTEE